MNTMEEQILRTSKEIIVKFIEVGRVSPSSFAETFTIIYDAVAGAVRAGAAAQAPANPAGEPDDRSRKKS